MTSDTNGVTLHGVDLPVHVDERGITWEPWGGEPTGPQRREEHHPVRQPRCMTDMLCGGCGQQPDLHPLFGWLWVLSSADLPRQWPCEITTAVPPFCKPCALRAIRNCPDLDGGHMRVRATVSQISGVAGTLHLPGRPPQDHVVSLNDGSLRYVVARQFVRRLEFAELDRAPVHDPAPTGPEGMNARRPGPTAVPGPPEEATASSAPP
ncbi:hypothetical protein OG705_29610 [Streptomyces sp. NBC_00838]|uniref:hypothetical protein n=1 Tax=Streptomyces sp. NBC_00838 TaxID=2903680 RepID=UPI0038695EBE|nr:hypothetical protein OG705_29610 [Streptomyces sp. NBC_00838]